MDLCTPTALFRAAVPSGASTGIYEAFPLSLLSKLKVFRLLGARLQALELRDGDKGRLLGKGVLKARVNRLGLTR